MCVYVYTYACIDMCTYILIYTPTQICMLTVFTRTLHVLKTIRFLYMRTFRKLLKHKLHDFFLLSLNFVLTLRYILSLSRMESRGRYIEGWV